MVSEEKLVKDCKSGKSYALELLYNKYSANMLGVCMRYCSNKTEAEDILQEGFIKVFTNIGKYKKLKTSSLGGWIRRIIVNTALNHHRDNIKNKYYTDIDDIEDVLIIETEDDNNDADENKISEKEIMGIIQNLPEGYRIVFNLYVFEEYSHKKIAGDLNISVNTSKSQLSKARTYIKKELLKLNI
jgi:RNA polymerase sigma-70 factor (ECF subfamily)